MPAYQFFSEVNDKFVELWRAHVSGIPVPVNVTGTIHRLLRNAREWRGKLVNLHWRFTAKGERIIDVEWTEALPNSGVADEVALALPERPEDLVLSMSNLNIMSQNHIRLWPRLPLPSEDEFKRLAHKAEPIGCQGLRIDERYLFWVKRGQLRRMRRLPKLGDQLLARCKEQYALDRYDVLEIACSAATFSRNLDSRERRELRVSGQLVFTHGDYVVVMDDDDNVLSLRRCGEKAVTVAISKAAS